MNINNFLIEVYRKGGESRKAELHKMRDEGFAPDVPYSKRFFLKDKAYEHEKEIRGMLSPCLRNSISRTDWRKLVDSDDMSAVMGTATCEYLGLKGDVFYVPVNDGFVISICFNPRCPDYKKGTFMEVLQPHLD